MADQQPIAEKDVPPMRIPHLADEDVLRITTPGGETAEWVERAKFEQVQQTAFDLRRTLALAHMHLSFGDLGEARRRIEHDTGLTIEDARAMRDLVAEAKSWSSITPPAGGHTEEN